MKKGYEHEKACTGFSCERLSVLIVISRGRTIL
jgi:hypothetical protein